MTSQTMKVSIISINSNKSRPSSQNSNKKSEKKLDTENSVNVQPAWKQVLQIAASKNG